MILQYLQLLYISLLPALVPINELFFCLFFFMALNSLLSFVTSISAIWTLHASTILTHSNTCSMLTSFVFLIVVSYHTVLVIISPSFMPFINCSFHLLFPYILTHLPLYWDSTSILQHFHFVLLLIYSIVIMKLFHSVAAWSCHLMPQKSNNYSYTFLAPNKSGSAQTSAPPILARSVLLGPYTLLCITVISHENVLYLYLKVALFLIVAGHC